MLLPYVTGQCYPSYHHRRYSTVLTDQRVSPVHGRLREICDLPRYTHARAHHDYRCSELECQL